MSDVATPPKGQIVLDRLKKRLEGYRNHHDEVKPRFDHTINGVNEIQKKETLILRQRFVEAKNKKGPKSKGDKNKEGNQGNSAKSHKRQIDEASALCDGGEGGFEPSKKLAGSSNFMSPNKARFNKGNKFHHGQGNKNGLPPPPQPLPSMHPPPSLHSLEHFKHESCGFVELEQCAAALEKDGPDLINADMDLVNDLISEISDFSSADFMKDFDFGDDDDDKSDTLGSLTNSTNTPGVNLMDPHTHPALTPITPNSTNSPMHHGHGHGHVKMEGDLGTGHGMGMLAGHQCAGPSPAPATTASPLASQLNTGGTPPYLFDATGSPGTSASGSNKPGRVQPSLSGPTLPIDSPAAQTLKQMAEQHQHKQQMGGATTPNSFKNASPARSPFNEYGGQGMSNEFMGASSNVNLNSTVGGATNQQFQGAANVKQEVFSPSNQTSFSPGYMADQHGVKRQPPPPPQMNQSGGNRMGQQQVVSPVNKSFNSQGMESSPMMPGQSYMQRPQNNAASVGSPSAYPNYPGGGGQQHIPNPNQQQQMSGQGSPVGPIDPTKTRMVQQHPQPSPQYYYQNSNNVDPSAHFENGPQGQTINFTQQHLRVGSGPVPTMAPRMGAPTNMNRIPMPGPRPQQPPSQPPQLPQQQMMIRQQQQQQQHNMAQQHQQQMGVMNAPPGMMNRFAGPNGSMRGPPPGGQNIQPVMNAPPQQVLQQQRPMQSQPQMYNTGGQQMGMGGMAGGPGPSSMANMHMRQMAPYNGNHGHTMGSNGPHPSQQQHVQREAWMGQQQQQQYQQQMSRQGQQVPQRPNMQMGYHSGMPMHMQMQPQSQPVGGGMMPNYNQGPPPGNGSGMMPPQQMGGYNPHMQQQQQHVSGFNKGHIQPPPNYPGNNSSYASMKSNNPMHQQQMYQQQQVMKPQQQQQMSMPNDMCIDQMLKNITDDSQFSSGDATDLFHSIDSNYSSILDNL